MYNCKQIMNGRDSMTVGEMIRYYRKQLGMTMEELAKKVGTTKQNIYRYEKDKVNIPLDRFSLIADVLNVEPQVLMGIDTPASNNSENRISRHISDEELRFALFNGKEVTDEQYAEVLRFRDYILNRPN